MTLPQGPEDITAAWLSKALGRDVEPTNVEQIGIGVGLLGRLYRVTLDDSTTAIAKLPTVDEGARMNVVAPLRFYEKEVRFYNEAAEGAPVATAGVHLAEFDAESGDFVLLMEDIGDRRMADQIAGCSVADAETAVDALAALHGHWWNSASFPAWLPSYADPPFPQVIAGMFKQSWPVALEVLGDHLSPELREYGERYADLVPWFMENLTGSHQTFCHGDFRLDNLFFANDASQAPVTVVDWQICFRGRGGYDLAYFLSQSLTTEDRRANEERLIARYRDGLASHGVTYDAADLDADYRRTVAYCFIYPVASAGQIAVTNERMRDLLVGILDRAVQAIDDTKAFALLP